MKALLAGACALAMVVCSHAHAATFKPIAKGKSLVMTGIIEEGDDQRLIAAFNASCRKRGYCPERVFLNSEGGQVRAAILIGGLINKQGIDTVVGKTDMCVSSCFFVFAAGHVRVVRTGALIGVHNVYDANTGKVMADAVVTITTFLRDIGVPNSIIVKFATTPPDQVAWLEWSDVDGWVQYIK